MEQKPQEVQDLKNSQSRHKQPTIKSRRLLKSLKEQDSTFKFYGWDFAENYAYITYLSNFRSIFDSHEQRKRVKVFRHLAKLIKTRNPHQIKSHHQKMMLRHTTVDNIISFLKAKIKREIDIKPEYISIIEKINVEAQIFFIKELGLVNMKEIEALLRERKEKKLRDERRLNQSVKVQEDREAYLALKKEAEESPARETPECSSVKNEQNEEILLYNQE